MDKTQFKIAMASHGQGENVARRIAEDILTTYDTEGCDEEWFDDHADLIISGYERVPLTDFERFALLGAAIAHYDYDADLFFGVTSYGIVGHYIYDIARSMKEGD